MTSSNNSLFLPKEQAQQRYDICKTCTSFVALTTQCAECGCFMKLKVKIRESSCPLNKWDQLNTTNEQRING